MRISIYRSLVMAWLLFSIASAHAAITCSVSSNGFSTAYNPTRLTATPTQTSLTVSCTRGLITDPTTVSYSTVNTNGLNPSGANNRAALNGAFIGYDAYLDGSCISQWKGLTGISGSMTFGTTGPMSQTYNFWGCVPPGQTGLPAGTYFDLVIMTLNYGPSPQTSAFGFYLVNITTPATCSMTAPGSVAFGNYLAFGGALASSTSFGATCTNLLPYTVSVTPVGGVIVGLNYALSLTPPAGPGGTSLNARGSGTLQTYTINGSMVAGQAGICSSGSCVGTAPHTLTLSY